MAVAGGIDEMNLVHETQLIKAALLYADRVTLASPKALLLNGIAALSTGDRAQRIELMTALVSSADHEASVARYLEYRRNFKTLSPPDRTLLLRLEHSLAAVAEGIAGDIRRMSRSSWNFATTVPV